MIRRHPVLATVSLAYLIVLAWITLGPQPLNPEQTGMLRRILAALHAHIGLRWITYPLVEFSANIALFVPLGVLGVLLLGMRRWWIAVLIGVALSCVIETAQLALPTRVSDLRDIAANSIGTLLGALITLAIGAVSAQGRRRVT